MNVERQLQICMAALAALGTLLLGLGQRDAWLPVVAALAAIGSVYVVDMRQWFSLNRNLANVAALMAVVLSVVQFYKADSDQQLLAIANLLIYLQLVLMFQVKTDRVYWQLVVLSLLQVVVAAALNLGFEFGLLLLLYLVVALTSMFLFFVRRETRLFDAEEEEDQNEWWAFGVPVREGEATEEEEEKEPTAAAAPASSFAQVALPDGPDDAPARPLPGWSMLREVASLSAITLVFAAVLFYSVPRSADGQQQLFDNRSQSLVGFNPEGVKLNDSGRIQEDDRTALRMTLRTRQGDPVRINEELYLRGGVQMNYSSTSGAWSDRVGKRISSEVGRPLTAPPTGEYVLQDITLDHPGHNVLFGIYPAYDAGNTDRAVYYAYNEQLLGERLEYKAESRRPSSFHYQLATTGIRNGRQSRFQGLDAMELQERWPPGLSESERNKLLSTEGARPPLNRLRERLPKLIELAHEIVKDVPAENRLDRVRAIENHFRFSSQYRYTLDFSTIPPRPDLDPVEYFVSDHRQGNCRYFASAACLMLRSLGIEARMVSGYKGGEYNAIGGFYVVRQRDAHAWVEAYLPFEDLPPDGLAEGEPRESGAWFRIDPTPDSPESAFASFDHGPFSWVGQSLDYAQVVWNDYVVTLNSERQQEAIFRPLLDRTSGLIEKAFQSETWRSFFATVAQALGLSPHGWFVQYWYLWLGLVIVPLVVLSAWLTWLFAAPLIRLLFTGHWTDPNVKGPARSRVPFYARLEELLAAAGLTRGRGQTPREFVLALGANLNDVPFLRDAVPLVREVTEAYYRVRYGGQQLSWDERAEIERDLLVLGRVLGAQLAPAARG